MVNNSIPKIIHYCWFGGNPLPELALRCIESWKKYFPDYEIKEWNETNFDVNIIPYTAQAYKAKKYAFVSDYARFWILYKYGGLYFDTDVEVVKNMDDIISKGSFMGCENWAQPGATPAQLGVAPGLGLGVNPGQGLIGEILDHYKTLSFLDKNGKPNLETIVEITTKLLCKYGLQNVNEIQNVRGVNVYPKDYFCPIDMITEKLKISSNTVSIHWYMGSWVEHRQWRNIRSFLRKILPEHLFLAYNKFKKKLRHAQN